MENKIKVLLADNSEHFGIPCANVMRSAPDADIAAAAAARNIKNKCRKRKNRCFGNGFFVILRDRAHSGTARFSLRRFRRKLP